MDENRGGDAGVIIGMAGPSPTLSGRRPSETLEIERLLRPVGEW